MDIKKLKFKAWDKEDSRWIEIDKFLLGSNNKITHIRFYRDGVEQSLSINDVKIKIYE